jgi:hypothetical protein
MTGSKVPRGTQTNKPTNKLRGLWSESETMSTDRPPLADEI